MSIQGRDGETLLDLLATGAGDAPAIRAPGEVPLDHGALRRHIERTAAALRELGIARGDRVAIVLPNGAAMATAFLGVAAAAVAAPLNPAYTRDELDFYLGDLSAKALIVAGDETGPAFAAAEARAIPLLRLTGEDGAGAFRLEGAAARASPTATGAPVAADDALVLHTSGTTSRPKIVPLTHANIAASARNIAAALALTNSDVGLNIMPLFHIHGLIAGLLAPLSAGGAVVCTPGFNGLKFAGWLAAEQPTWYSAVPTMHQAILDRLARNPEAARAAALRFVRSSSASLPPQVFHALADLFGCPVIESYGMTEAAHQMAANPLRAGAQKSGSVGIAAGPEVRIADAAGQFRAIDVEGEIVIRGANVTPGYADNPKANAEAFFNARDGGDRWFRTGDLGRLDADGYLSVTGRIKEIINRGGEKIAPREVDEVLMDHAGVAQALTFAMPHKKLGEDVAAAVVLRHGASASEDELRKFAATRLAAFKVPRRIVIVPEIPKGPTGKLQRIGLASRLGLGEE